MEEKLSRKMASRRKGEMQVYLYPYTTQALKCGG
jgi:hypothetical protein